MTCLAKAEAEVFPHSRNLLLALSSFCFRPLWTRARQAARSRLDPRIDWPKLHCCFALSIVTRAMGDGSAETMGWSPQAANLFAYPRRLELTEQGR